MIIRDAIDVLAQPTVVRLDSLDSSDPSWISDSYYITEEIDRHFRALKALFSKKTGCGVFLIGHYGSGKSHFLAYLAQQLEAGAFPSRRLHAFPLSLLNFKASRPLESILMDSLAEGGQHADRRVTWKQIDGTYPDGLCLILDELSEFLRSKPSAQGFNEDLRFLQFLGEWAQEHPLWIVASLQEQIEHTGEMEYDLYRKIKDRYPIKLLLTPTHIKDLIAHRILRKKPIYAEAVEKLAKELMEVYPGPEINYADFCQIYPIHPVSLQLLEEVRDRFSQARGVIDFTLTQLLGSEARETTPFLDRPWGHLLTPDVIIDHFADLFEVQPEFLDIAQKILPHFRQNIPVLFPNKKRQDLAWRLFKLLILVHLSPRRKLLEVDQAAQWLLFKISSLDPDRNREFIRTVLDVMVREGSFVKQVGSGYRLDLEDDSKANLDRLLGQTMEELEGRGDAIFESLIPCLEEAEFNPFSLPRDRWQTRRIRWHFHARDIQVFLGGGAPSQQKNPSLQVGIPWGPPPDAPRCFRVIPKRLELTPDILELAALFQLRERPLHASVLNRIRERIRGRSTWFFSLIRTAYSEATVMDSVGDRSMAGQSPPRGDFGSWLDAYGKWMLKLTYPQFEKFAPGHGPLPKEAYRQFMRFATENDLGAEEAPEFVKLIREAYLVPMGLMQRRGPQYMISMKLDSHELVKLLRPVLDHHPTPDRVYAHLAAPVYGLVPDQVHLLLMTLLIQGEIDITKGQRSFKDTYETLINPLKYDKIIPGHALNLSHLRDLQVLCEGFHVQIPRQWSVLAQKRAIGQLRRIGNRQRDQLGDFLIKLKSKEGNNDLVAQIERFIVQWLALEEGEHELQGFQHFLYAIGSPQHFLTEAGRIQSLPDRFERLVGESERLRHLLSYPCLAQCTDPEVASAAKAKLPAPSLTQPEAFQSWLDDTLALYKRYQSWYRRRHNQWWEDANRHRLWSFQLPRVALSNHLGLDSLRSELEALQAKAKEQRCPGLSSLEFQPMCRCGFDGEESPLSETVRRFDESAERLETEMALFFQQVKVKSKVKEWVDQSMEVNARTLSYLDGQAAYPEVENLALFDQHLSGLELVQSVHADELLDVLGERPWEKAALMKAMDQFLSGRGPRISFRREKKVPRRELVAWCCEQALRIGCPLPTHFTLPEQRLIPDLLEAHWVSEESLLNLENMGFDEEAIVRLLEMLLEGLVPIPKNKPRSGPVAACLHLMKPQVPTSVSELAHWTHCLYQQNERLLRLRREAWLRCLDDLARTNIQDPPAELPLQLGCHLQAQWVVIDCLGLGLTGTVKNILPECFPHSNLEALEFALVSRQSSTDAFYRSLLEENVNKSFQKINAVDNLIHNRNMSFQELLSLARAELEIAFRKLRPRLDPTRPILLFGDHGFRLTPDGAGYSHGGDSFLERVTPLFLLAP